MLAVSPMALPTLCNAPWWDENMPAASVLTLAADVGVFHVAPYWQGGGSPKFDGTPPIDISSGDVISKRLSKKRKMPYQPQPKALVVTLTTTNVTVTTTNVTVTTAKHTHTHTHTHTHVHTHTCTHTHTHTHTPETVFHDFQLSSLLTNHPDPF